MQGLDERYKLPLVNMDIKNIISGANWTTNTAMARFYQDLNGNWWMKFNLNGATSPAAALNIFDVLPPIIRPLSKTMAILFAIAVFKRSAKSNNAFFIEMCQESCVFIFVISGLNLP